MTVQTKAPLRVGIVGFGNIGSAHAAAIVSGKVPSMSLTALCDTDLNKCDLIREKYPAIPVFDNEEAFLRSHLFDSVIICVPHYGHAPLAVAAFRAGYHVLTEKPASVTALGARQMITAWQEAGTAFGVMFNQRTNPLFSECRRLVQSGEIGELRRSVWIITNWFRKDAYYASGAWRASYGGEGGGVLMNQAPHNLDLWQWICGMPKALRATCPTGKYHDIEVEDEACLFAAYGNGATGVFLTTTGEYPGTNRLEIDGTRGKLVVEHNRLTVSTAQYDARDYVKMPEDAKNPVTVKEIEGEKFDGHPVILENFAKHVLYGEPLLAPGEEALNEVLLCNAAYLSAWTGEEVAIPMDEARFEKLLEEKKKTSRYQGTAGPSGREGTGGYLDRWNTNW